MPQTLTWGCRACRAPLGVVGPDGALEPQVSGIRLGADGIGRITCPACSSERRWLPQSRSTAKMLSGDAVGRRHEIV
jgi:hypothetical protein